MMTTRARYRSGPLLIALAAMLVGLSWAGPTPGIEEVQGSGWLTGAACVGCAAGLVISAAAGGAGFWAWAVWTRIGSAAVVGCVGTCVAAVTQ